MMADRSPVRVLVPTTSGLIEVERLIEEQIARSVICVGASTLHNPQLDKAYSDFIAPGTGVIERLFRNGSFRLEVSQEIDHGSSWQLGAFIAHALHAAGRLAEKGHRADTAVWATGEVRYDLSVAPVGHVDDKLRLSLQQLMKRSASGERVIVALPRDNAHDAADWLGDLAAAAIKVLALDRVSELMSALGLKLPMAAAASDEGASATARRRMLLYAGLGVSTVCVGAAVAIALTWGDDWPIVLTLPKTQYVIGEPFAFTLRANRDCPFLVLTVDAQGRPKLYDPAVEGAFMGNVVLKARERRRIPVSGVAVVQPPTGTYQIAAVCTKEELARLGLHNASARNRRNFGFKHQDAAYTIDRDAFDKVAVTYEVRER